MSTTLSSFTTTVLSLNEYGESVSAIVPGSLMSPNRKKEGGETCTGMEHFNGQNLDQTF